MNRIIVCLLCTLVLSSLQQVSAQGDDHGNTCSTATPVDFMSSTLGDLIANDLDHFLIQIPSPNALLTVYTIGNTNTTGRLYQLVDEVAIFLREDFSSGDNNNFLLTGTLDPGTYCIEVSGHNESILGPYVLRVEADLPTDDHGNSCQTATPVGDPMITGELSVFDDRDFFLLQIPSPGGMLTVNTTGGTNTTGRIYQLFDGEPIFLREDFSSGDNNNFLLTGTLDPGTYCIEVSGHNESILGPYVLQASGDFIPASACTAENVMLSISSMEFGEIPLGNLSSLQTVIVTNISADPQSQVFIEASTLTSNNASDFGILNDTCAGQVLLPGNTCALSGIFAPLTEGVKTAVIRIPCNDPNTPPLEVIVSGTGQTVAAP